MDWARKPNPDVAHYEAKMRQPSAALRAGDLILVKVKDQRKDPGNPGAWRWSKSPWYRERCCALKPGPDGEGHGGRPRFQ